MGTRCGLGESTGERRPMHAVEMGHSCCTARQPQESGCGLKRNSPPHQWGTTFAPLQDATLTTTRLFLSCYCSHASTCSLPGGMDGDIRSALPEAHVHQPGRACTRTSFLKQTSSQPRLPNPLPHRVASHIPSSTSENPSCPPGSFSDLVCFFAS